jgi:hypothetical protein
MIKLVQCVRRRPRLTVDEFRAAWETYGERLREVAIELGATRVTLSTTLETPLNDALAAARGSARPYDGVAEVAWPSGGSILADAALPGARERIVRLRALQERFVDAGRSTFFFVHEQEVLGERDTMPE